MHFHFTRKRHGLLPDRKKALQMLSIPLPHLWDRSEHQPYYQESSVDNIYESYDFNSGKGLDDTSENDRDLTLASDSTAKVQNKALVLSEIRVM